MTTTDDRIVDDEASLIRWMGDRGKVCIEGGREIWLANTRLKPGWLVRWFRDDDQYSMGEAATLVEALRQAVEAAEKKVESPAKMDFCRPAPPDISVPIPDVRAPCGCVVCEAINGISDLANNTLRQSVGLPRNLTDHQ